jgi:hypothetical protein
VSKFKLFQKQLDSVVKNTTNLRELQKLAVEVMVILENRMNELRAKEIEKYSTGQVVQVDIEGEVIEFKVVKTTPSNRIHGKGLQGKYFNEVFSFLPDAVLEIKNG